MDKTPFKLLEEEAKKQIEEEDLSEYRLSRAIIKTIQTFIEELPHLNLEVEEPLIKGNFYPRSFFIKAKGLGEICGVLGTHYSDIILTGIVEILAKEVHNQSVKEAEQEGLI